MKFRKRPVVIEAVQWTGENGSELRLFLGEKKFYHVLNNSHLIIPTMEGDMTAMVGDWIIKGVVGEFYPCKPDIFEETYEPVEEQP